MGEEDEGRHIKVDGAANISYSAGKLIVEPVGGSVICAIVQGNGAVTMHFHPMSGWYVLMDARKLEGGDSGASGA